MDEKRKEFQSIPTSKVQRAMKVIGASAKVGGNYAAHYAKSMVGVKETKAELDRKNAETVIGTLGEMKGTALKMAQMLSMDEFTLPEQYQKAFEQAQHNAPPLSFPLVQKTIRSQFGKEINELFDSFSKNAIHAASIGQVHRAEKDGVNLAVKIQYPGVAESIESDIRLMKPIAQKMLNVPQNEMEFYIEEVQKTLVEETDYMHELKMGELLYEKCKPVPNLRIPKYYSDLTRSRVLTMEFVEGDLLTEWLSNKPSEAQRQIVAQTIWDAFLFQIQELRMVHADPHPGNFIITYKNEVCLIDFGCVKELDEEFYKDFFELLDLDVLNNDELLKEKMYRLNYLNENDKPEEIAYLFESLKHSMLLIAEPFQHESFSFANWDYMKGLYSQGEELAKEMRKRRINSARGPKQGIYLLRTFYGLYMILAKLGAEVKLNYTLIQK
jgi:predicted unusual protein kinase regulating ubiquinone biosynthesis (AarF/ABC1/UbiB family)